MSMHPRFSAIWVVLLIGVHLAGVRAAFGEPEATNRQAVLVTSNDSATEAGLLMLERGGNSVDAAVAAAFALGVVEPHRTGIGGGGLALIRDGSTGLLSIADFRERAPSGASEELYMDEQGKPDLGRISRGPLSVCVPGQVAGLCAIQEDHGRLSLPTVLEPAIALAEDGFTINSSLAREITDHMELLDGSEGARTIFLRGPNIDEPANRMYPRREGDRLIQADLASTLRLISRYGPEAYYRGETARRIASAVGESILGVEDLGSYYVALRDPISIRYRAYDVLTAPPPCAGGVHLAQILNFLGAYELDSMGRLSSPTIHLMAEAMKLSFSDQLGFVGDPGFVEQDVLRVTSTRHAAVLRAEFRSTRALGSGELRPPQSPSPFRPLQTQVVAMDTSGTIVCLSSSLGTSFGSGIVVPETGILLNNSISSFDFHGRQPGALSAFAGTANEVEGGKAPASFQTPFVAFQRENALYAGMSSGGESAPTALAQVLVNLLDFGEEAAESLLTPRVHHQWVPDELSVEDRALTAEARRELEALGHEIAVSEQPSRVLLIGHDPLEETLTGAVDPRGSGSARGL